MKKLLSLVLALAMMASLAVYLPLGVSAVEPAASETIYAENFDGKDGTYTAAELANLLGWTLLRGDADAEVATIADGVLTLDSGDVDLVFTIATDFRLTQSCTVQFDLAQVSYDEDGEKTQAANIAIGSYDPATQVTRAIMPKCNYEGYHHLALANGNIDEGKYSVEGFIINGGGHVQARSESILWGGGYSQPTTMTTWKNVYDMENNQVDCYSSGARINSTAGDSAYDNIPLADYMGKDAMLRVQQKRVAQFDNISIVTGGEAIVNNTNVVYEQNFDDITYDPETQSASELAAMLGWKNLDVAQGQDPTALEVLPDGTTGGSIKVSTTYKIVDGMLDILNPYGAASVSSQIFIPEMETAREQVVIEYDMMYVYEGGQLVEGSKDQYKEVYGEYDGGDQELGFTMYGRRSDFNVNWLYTQKGFNKMGFSNGSATMSLTQLRPQNIAYKNLRSGYQYSDQGSSHYNVYNSLDHVKVVLDLDGGVEIYTNGVLTWFLNEDQLAKWNNTSQGGGDDIIGNILKLTVKAGCHVRLDNMKVTVDPEEIPEVLITEVATSVNGVQDYQYVEVYNNSDEAVNIYDYSLVVTDMSNSLRKQGTVISPEDVLTVYPGRHYYESISTDKTTGASLYEVMLRNPAYTEGWIQPGEVAVIWNTANAMHSGTAEKPTENEKEWKRTEEDFRAATYLSDDIKVFKSYNDYNRTLSTEGKYVVALVEQTLFQPRYVPEFDWGNRGVAKDVLSSYDNFISYVYMLPAGSFDPYDNVTLGDNMNKNEEGVNAYPTNSGSSYRPFLSDALDPKTGAPQTLLTAQFVYGNNNRSREGIAMNRENVETRYDASPGIVYNAQKRVMSYSVDGNATEKYLGTKTYYDVLGPEDGKQTLYSMVNGAVTYNQPMNLRVNEDTVIRRVGTQVTTLKGAALNVLAMPDGDPAIQWTTAIQQADFLEIVNEHYGTGKVIAKIETGTLVAKTADLTDGVTLTVENVTEEGKVWKLGAKETQWLADTGTYGDFFLIKGTLAVDEADYGTAYSAVGYVSVTLINGQVLTIYGGYNEANHSRSVHGLASAIVADNYSGYASGLHSKIDTLVPVE